MQQHLEELAATADVYGLLSLCYSSPADKAFSDELPARLKRALQAAGFFDLEDEMDRMGSCFGDSEEELRLKLEYTRLFRGPVKALAYPYESMNVEGEVMGQSTLSVVKCYSEMGVGPRDGFDDLPDHITVEVEFVRYLSLKEIAAIQSGRLEEARYVRKVRLSFIRDHLLKWAPRFTSAIESNTASPFYAGLARITPAFLLFDITRATDRQPAPAR